MKPLSSNVKNQSGQVVIVVLALLVVISIMMMTLLNYTGVQIVSHRNAVYKLQALNIAEAGAEIAIWKLNNQSGYTGENNTSYGNGVYTTTITDKSNGTKLIKVDSYIPDATNPAIRRTLQITASGNNIKNISFAYAVQTGQGGLSLGNNASISGNIYSNGSIVGSGGGQGRPVVSGDVISVMNVSNMRVTGNVTADNISGSDVSLNANIHSSVSDGVVAGNVSANSITNCTINGNAVYNSQISPNCSVSGARTTPNNNVPSLPATLSMPISDDQITAWQNEATGGGTIGSQTIDTGSLGPIKINGDLTINTKLTINGTIWVTGNINLGNGATMQLASSYGILTGVVLAGTGDSTSGVFSASNNTTIAGSGTEGSYLLLISERNDTSSVAITISNNASSAIIYAAKSQVQVSNNAQIKEITAYQINLSPKVDLTSSSGNINAAYFSSIAPTWKTDSQTWQLLK